jgi:hypothetical protein
MKTSPVKSLLILLAAVLTLLACRLPGLPGRATETPIPADPTITATAPEPTLTEAPTAAVPLQTEETETEEVHEEEPAGETGDFPLEYKFDEDLIDPPVESWSNLPIMPGAVGGYDSPGSYAYFVDAELDEVNTFYETFLTESGYSLFVTVVDDAESLLKMYLLGDKMVSIAALHPEGETLTMIILVSD